MAAYGATTPFLLLARCHIKPDAPRPRRRDSSRRNVYVRSYPRNVRAAFVAAMHRRHVRAANVRDLLPQVDVDAYLAAAAEADAGVRATEPGMLHHTFDQDPDDDRMFVWSEVYKDDVRARRGSSFDASRRRRGCHVDIPWMNRGGAAAATRIFLRRIAATPRPRRGYSSDASWRRRGRDGGDELRRPDADVRDRRRRCSST